MHTEHNNTIPNLGICTLCGGTYGKSVMSNHLRQCIVKSTSAQSIKPGSYTRYNADNQHIIHVGIRDAGPYSGQYGEYWLHLAIQTNTQLYVLDRFLRDLWLECCGHLSHFAIGRLFFISSGPWELERRLGLEDLTEENDITDLEALLFDNRRPDPWDYRRLDIPWPAFDELSMDFPIGIVTRPKLKLTYEYDFGSTTRLEVRCMSMYRHATEEEITLLARNNPPGLRCTTCGTVPQWIYPASLEPEAAYCDVCAKGRKDLAPVINSPRNGVCGYGYVEYEDDWY